MAPSDMLLRIGQVAGYNNEIVVAIGGQKLGVNAGANVATPPPNALGEKGIVAPPEPGADKQAGVERTAKTSSAGVVLRTQYDEEKTALIVGGVVAGLLGLWLVSSRRFSSGAGESVAGSYIQQSSDCQDQSPYIFCQPPCCLREER